MIISDDSDTYTKFPPPQNELPAESQHVRSFSTESDVSNYSAISYESSGSEAPFSQEQNTELLTKFPSLHLSNIISASSTSSPSVSPTVSLPDNLPLATPDDYLPSLRHAEAQLEATLDSMVGQQHGRNASYSVAREPSPLNTRLSTKKSLPDLRGVNRPMTERMRSHVNQHRIPDMPGTRIINPDLGEIDHWTNQTSLHPPQTLMDYFLTVAFLETIPHPNLLHHTVAFHVHNQPIIIIAVSLGLPNLSHRPRIYLRRALHLQWTLSATLIFVASPHCRLRQSPQTYPSRSWR